MLCHAKFYRIVFQFMGHYPIVLNLIGVPVLLVPTVGMA